VGPDIAANGEARAAAERGKAILRGEPGTNFRHVAVLFAITGNIRRWTFVHADVRWHPEPDDGAHANIVFIDKAKDEFTATDLDDILEHLSKADASQIGSVPAARGGPPS
jgi:hypothetical protein